MSHAKAFLKKKTMLRRNSFDLGVLTNTKLVLNVQLKVTKVKVTAAKSIKKMLTPIIKTCCSGHDLVKP